MKRPIYILILFSIGLLSCKKEKNITEKEFPKTVTFEYNGESVIYNVIKKTYYKDSKGNSLNTAVTKLWLDRNLGAKRAAIVKNDSLASGDLFQWGRLADGHQKRNSDTIQKLSTGIIPGHDKFIAIPLHSEDWLVVSNDSLWNDVKNTNCSCPDGWRVPTSDELAMEMYSWSPKNMDGAYASELKWVSSGNRDNHGTERYSTYFAFIWSSTPTTNSWAYALAIPGSETADISTSPRIYGLAIRCIKNY